MRIKPRPSTSPRFRRFTAQVQRPRLRPIWRIALKAAAAAVSIALLYLGEHAAVTAVVRVEPTTPAARSMSPKEERAFDALLARLDAQRKEDEERARRIAATHIDPLACELDFHVDVPFCDEWMYRDLAEQRAARARAGEEIGSALERWISARPASGPSPSATAMLRR